MTPTITKDHAKCQNCNRTRKIHGDNPVRFELDSVKCIRCGERNWTVLTPNYQKKQGNIQ